VSENTAAQTGNIYDLGYRGYDGERLGRSYAIVSLYLYSLRAIFGLGRSAWAKVFPFGLAAIALIPASVQLAIAAIAPADLELIKPESYFEFVQVIVALFCAVSAPEIIGRDQRHHTLPLYFSRSLSRADYVSSKLAALATALFAVLALPQFLLLTGNALADEDLVGYIGDNLTDPAVLAGSSGRGLHGSVSLAIGR
jgi:ABC-2 type transport system permease protein